MRLLRHVSLFALLTAVIFVAEATVATALVVVSDRGWSRELWPVTVPLALAVMVVAAALAAHFVIVVARRVLLAGFQARLDQLEAARSESHRQLATMIPAFSMLLGGMESQRRMVEGLRSQLLPAADQLAGETGPARTLRAPMLNALSFAAGIARDAEARIASARELRARLGRAEQTHSVLLHGLREMQDLFDTLPGMSSGPAMFPAETPAAASAPAAPDAGAPAPAAPLSTTSSRLPFSADDALPPALRARLEQRPLDLGKDNYDLGLN